MNSNKKDNSFEHFGRIIRLSDNYGFVKSEITSKDYYFRYDSSQSKFCINDNVVFLLYQTQSNETASALRIFYTNDSGIKFYPRVNQNHIHLLLEKYLPDIIRNIKDNEHDILEIEHEYPYNIGKSSCVKTDENDSIIYAVRKGRTGHTRFVKNKNAEDCNTVFAVFKRTTIGYLILTVFVGKKAGREPWDKFATYEDIKFWDNHALIFEHKEIIPGTETKKCPSFSN